MLFLILPSLSRLNLVSLTSLKLLFLAWVTPSEVETTNQGETGWASFDTADFGPPTGSSSPSQAKMETDHETKTQG